jgi:trehalose 6-phosphate synthase/phosphatase
MKHRLLIASNRLPVDVMRRGGTLRFKRSVGGLATGLGSYYTSTESLWIGWPGIPSDRLKKADRETVARRLGEESCVPVFLSGQDVKNYYHGFCNNTLWPLFHYFTQYTMYEERYWKAYRRVNEAFCDAVVEEARPNDIIWIQDYHLLLLPQLIRERLPNAQIGFFLHIPFPSYELFRLLPWRKELMTGLLGADLIGFHTYDYVRHFLSTTRRLLGYEQTFGQISVGNRVVKAEAFPMGIDYEKYASAGEDPAVKEQARRIREELHDRTLIVSVDRLDYTKGILERLAEYEQFLSDNPDCHECVVLILVVAPSRTRVEDYRQLKRQVDERVGAINGRYGSVGWVPVWYLYQTQSFVSLRALYEAADVALVTPLRDGMNLIAKEFVASKTDGTGVLVLSEMAGAASELGEALLVNPLNRLEVADALKTALSMPKEEQIVRNRAMQARLRRYDVVRWASDFIEQLLAICRVKKERLSSVIDPQEREDLIAAYRSANRRLLLLDYDGTLVPFADRPEAAAPDQRVKRLLAMLITDPKNEVVLVSGRDRETLDGWLGDLDIGCIAEHGVWVRARGSDWQIVAPLTNTWKAEVRPILELYTDRTPGALIEEKEYSLVWHYRRVDPALAGVRAMEIKETLLQFASNLALEVREGSRTIEIKNTGIDKGRAASQWLNRQGWEFILAIGDDWTDEDTFRALPSSAYSIRVRLVPTNARFNLESVDDVRALLSDLTSSSVATQS